MVSERSISTNVHASSDQDTSLNLNKIIVVLEEKI